MFVLTIDQRASRRSSDEVPALLETVNAHYRDALVLPFERTAGDEVQGLIADAGRVVDLVVDAVRRTHWSVGIGAGDTEQPAPESVRAGRGEAYVSARDAVERAKSAPYPVCVSGARGTEAARAETACWLLAGVIMRRSQAGWQAVDAMSAHARQKTAAAELGITPQAMSRRLQVAGLLEEQRGRALAEHLLEVSQ